jgi:hypothetical protein
MSIFNFYKYLEKIENGHSQCLFSNFIYKSRIFKMDIPNVYFQFLEIKIESLKWTFPMSIFNFYK